MLSSDSANKTLCRLPGESGVSPEREGKSNEAIVVRLGCCARFRACAAYDRVWDWWREPPATTTVQGDLVGTSEEEPVQPDEAGGDREEDEDGYGTKGEGKEKGRTRARLTVREATTRSRLRESRLTASVSIPASCSTSMSKQSEDGVAMWGEGASDFWGYLQWEEHDRELEILDGEREPPSKAL